nr:NADH dehydrogenase subunit 5 [Cichlidogyrus thurstonae]
MIILWGLLTSLAVIILFGLNLYLFYGLDFSLLSSNLVGLEVGINQGDYLCFSMLFFCGFISLLFSLHYFGWIESWLNFLILGFLSVMLNLIASEDVILGLFWWEYLGVVSFFLILYYGNFDTLFAGNTTIVASRGGDVGFFLLICYCIGGLNLGLLGVICILLIVLTKSAVIPFCSWLLEAMRAPTPVSCLVHSSTLVAAGVWFVASYGEFLFSDLVSTILLVCCLTTIMLSGIVALVFCDIKKIVALSTCNNISWCLVYYLLSSPILCLCQLVCHGVGKCMLFIAIGDSLSSAGGSQNKSCFSLVPANSLLGLIGVSLLSISVAGFPFLGVFFTKHAMLNGVFYNSSLLLISLMFCCIFISYAYSLRLVFLVCSPFGVNNQWLNNTYYFLSSLVLLCSVFGYFFGMGLEELTIVSFWGSFGILCANMIGVFVGYYFYITPSNELFWSSFGFNDDSVSGVLKDFSLFSVINSILFNFRGEVSIANFLSSFSVTSLVRLTSIPLFSLLVLITTVM